MADPDKNDWLTTEQAAVLWDRLLKLTDLTVWHPVSANMVRRMCRDGVIQALGIEVLDVPGRWYISKRSSLEHILGRLDEVERLVRSELGEDDRERDR